jgi:hypothetical protein
MSMAFQNKNGRRSAIDGRTTTRYSGMLSPSVFAEAWKKLLATAPRRAVAQLRDDFPGRAARCLRECRCAGAIAFFDEWGVMLGRRTSDYATCRFKRGHEV